MPRLQTLEDEVQAMSDHHTHDDCVQCLAKRVMELQAEVDAYKEEIAEGVAEEESKICITCGYHIERHAGPLLTCPSYANQERRFRR